MTDFGKKAGDMFKADYDANDAGSVDRAAPVETSDHVDATKIGGVIINDAAKADQKALVYDFATNRIIYASIAICTLSIIDPLNLISNAITIGLSHAIT